MLIFIDESGDPGFKLNKGSAAVFVAVLVAFRDLKQARAAQSAIEGAATRLRVWPEFKFSKCRPEVRDAFFETVRPFDFDVRAIVVEKARIYSEHLRSEKEAVAAGRIKARSFTLDGEAVVLGQTPSHVSTNCAGRQLHALPVLYAFDLIEHDGEDLRDRPFLDRKAALARLLRDTEASILINEHIAGDGPTVFEHACRLGAEGSRFRPEQARLRASEPGHAHLFLPPR